MKRNSGRDFLNEYVYTLRGICLFLFITGTGRLFADKTVFLLDYVPTPLYTWDRSYYLQNPLLRTLHDASIYLLGHIWGSKIYLASIFFLSIYLGFLRGKFLIKKYFNKTESSTQQWIVAISMLLFVCNPFFSSRYGTQPGIWLSTILMGYGIYMLTIHRGKRQRKNTLLIGILRGAALMSMYHASFMIALLLVTCFIICYKQKKSWIHLFSIGFIVVLLNINRLVTLGGSTLQTIASGQAFDEQNIQEFATYAHSGLGVLPTVAMGYGFRGEKYGSAFVPTSVNERWWIAGSFLLLLSVIGWWSLYTTNNGEKKSYAYRILICIVCSIILGVGISSDLFAPITKILYAYVPGYLGLREPQKWIGVYMMFLLPLIILGRGKSIEYFSRLLPTDMYSIAMIGILLAWSPGVINGMKGRYTMINYPKNYTQTRENILKMEPSIINKSFIHLPWHSYQQCNRTRKIIANTLDRFFYPLQIIVSDNIEIGDLYTNSIDKRSKDIELFLQTKDTNLLTKHGIGGVLFTKTCADYKSYSWIATLSGSSLLLENKDISVYSFK